MFIPDNAPKAAITIQGQVFQCPLPFFTGYVLRENDASQLNQVFCENIRNNVAGKFTETEGEVKTFACTEAQFDEYVAGYDFGLRKVGGGEAKLSPVEREARKIAKEKIAEALRKAGKTINTKTDEGKASLEKMVSDLSKNEKIVREAEKRVKAVEKISLEELDLDFGSSEPQKEAA